MNKDVPWETIISNVKNTNEDLTATELQQHKSLFILYGLYFHKFDEELFDADFQAWKYGPVEQNLRYGYKEIIFNFQGDNEQEVKNKENSVEEWLNELLNADVNKLVSVTHKNPTWKKAKSSGRMWEPMNNEDIKNDYRQKN